MSGYQRCLFLAIPLGLLSLTGCHRWCCRQSCYRPSTSALVRTEVIAARPPCPVPLAPAAPLPPPVRMAPPALGTPIPAPAPPAVAPPPAPPTNSLPAAPLPPSESRWGPPRDPSVTLLPPEPVAPDRPREPAAPPSESPEPPAASRPPAAEDRRPTPPLPVGIRDFAAVREGVSTGRRPELEGLTWLKERGYRTILHVREPGTRDDADRKVVQDLGSVKYLSLEVSPEKLTPQVVEEFHKIVADPANRPLFIYGPDMLRGGLWYLHFRYVDRLSEEEAVKKAAEMGLKSDRDGMHRDMWLAINKYLADNPPPK